MFEVKELHHSDCRNFCSVDVAKGVCRRTQDLVLIDSTSCECYVQLPKCKFCANYAANGDQTGVCKAEQGEPWAYPEMIAVTCEMFTAA
jgi:4-hydroxyphenylacetate decarboxylase small subunit